MHKSTLRLQRTFLKLFICLLSFACSFATFLCLLTPLDMALTELQIVLHRLHLNLIKQTNELPKDFKKKVTFTTVCGLADINLNSSEFISLYLNTIIYYMDRIFDITKTSMINTFLQVKVVPTLCNCHS